MSSVACVVPAVPGKYNGTSIYHGASSKLLHIGASVLRDSQALRERIMEAAAALFAEFGYAETSLNRIAEKAGVAKGSIFYHFKNKDGLLAALVEEGFKLIYQAVEKPIQGGRQPAAQLAALMRKHFGLYIEYSSLSRIIFSRSRYGVSPEAASRIDTAQQRYRNFVAALIQQGIEAGEIRPVHAHFAAAVLMSELGGAAEAWLSREGLPATPTQEKVVEQMLQMALHGVLLG